MTSRKQPTAGFWITVALVAVLAYPLSFGPAWWISSRIQPSGATVSAVYRPVIWSWTRGGEVPNKALLLYVGLGQVRGGNTVIDPGDENRLPEIYHRRSR